MSKKFLFAFESDYKIGEYVNRGKSKGKVIGYAKGKDGRDCLCVQMLGKRGDDGSHWKTWLWPENECKLFVEDSLEAIERDATKDFNSYWLCSGFECQECKRCYGTRPTTYYNVSYCFQAKTIDLLARQRKVLERDAK